LHEFNLVTVNRCGTSLLEIKEPIHIIFILTPAK
jgi:hypothetical protein